MVEGKEELSSGCVACEKASRKASNDLVGFSPHSTPLTYAELTESTKELSQNQRRQPFSTHPDPKAQSPPHPLSPRSSWLQALRPRRDASESNARFVPFPIA